MGRLNLFCTLQNHYAAGNNERANPATLKLPFSSALEHSLGKGEVSGSSPDEGIAQKAASTMLYKNFKSRKNTNNY